MFDGKFSLKYSDHSVLFGNVVPCHEDVVDVRGEYH